jgi:hypothetical protein
MVLAVRLFGNYNDALDALWQAALKTCREKISFE